MSNLVRPQQYIEALSDAACYSPTTGKLPVSAYQNANRPARGDTNDDASTFSGLSGATAINGVEKKDGDGGCGSLLRRMFHKVRTREVIPWHSSQSSYCE